MGGRNFDKVINEWKCKADDLTNEIGASQSECRNFSSEYFRIKSANEEIIEHLDTVRGRIRTLLRKLKIFWTSLEREVGLSMSWTSRGGSLRLKRRSCRQGWKKLKLHWSRKKTRC